MTFDGMNLRLEVIGNLSMRSTELDYAIVIVPPDQDLSHAEAFRMVAGATGQCLDGATLHHAEWLITRDVEIIGRHGGDHCDQCSRHRAEAAAYVELDPRHRVALGTIHTRPDPARN